MQRPRTKPYPPLKKSRQSRKWLNDHRNGGSAHVSWSVDAPKFLKRKQGGSVSTIYTSCDIADCDRKISLYFDLDADNQARAFRKIGILIRSLQEFEVTMRQALEREKELRVIHAKELAKKETETPWIVVD